MECLLTEVEYVDAWGELQHASTTDLPDMLYMAKGSGGEFPGVVTKFSARAFDAPTLYGLECAFPAAVGRAITKAWLSLLSELTKAERGVHTHLSTREASGMYDVAISYVPFLPAGLPACLPSFA